MTTKKIKDEIEGKKRKGNEKNGGDWIKKKSFNIHLNNEGKKKPYELTFYLYWI